MTSTRESRDIGSSNPFRAPAPRATGLIIPAGFAIAFIFAMLIAATVWPLRQDIWDDATRANETLVQEASQDIQRKFELFDVLLHDVAGTLQDPAIFSSPEARTRTLSRTATISGTAGTLLLIGRDGKVEASSRTEITGSLGEQDYFTVHATREHVGLYVSRAFHAPGQQGPRDIALSRRINDADGRFAGVLVAIVHLAPLREVFATLNRNGSDFLQLMRDDGVVLIRQPDIGGSVSTGRDLSGTANFQRMMAAEKGSFTAPAAHDRQMRFYSFAHVGRLPLIVTAGLAADEILAPWRTRALLAGAGVLAVSVLSLGIAFALRREMMRRVGTQAELTQLSMTDGLTGVANRRHFDDMSQREWHRAQRIGSSIAVLMIDIDRFKLVNERLGRSAGDDVLRAIGQLVQHSLRRPGDFVARYGGEEFAAILPDTELYGAHDTAERIRTLIEKDVIKGDWPVTVSIGVAAVAASQDRTMGDLLSAVDRALYRAKESGRNRVVIERLQARAQMETADLP